MKFRETIARHFHSLVQIPRRSIFGLSDEKYSPINLPDDAATMFAGYIGRNYRPNEGVLFLAINPGGGGDSYVNRIPEDDVFYPLLKEFKSARHASVTDAFESVNDSFVQIAQGWNLWKILKPTLEAAGRRLDEIAYMNVVPYRTRENRMPPIAARRTAWTLVIDPTLRILQPKAIITLGKKAGSVADTLYTGNQLSYCVPRTIGDSWVSADAIAVHDRIRNELV